jgi:ATP-dependent Lon protease
VKIEAAGQILLFVGEPGTGKTAFAMSIAKALNRKFSIISLTKFASLVADQKKFKHSPIVDSLIECKSMNPVILLDEIDKVVD